MIPWGKVIHNADRVAVIGTGPSLRGVQLDIPPNVTTIAINGAVHLIQTDYWFTTDPSVDNRAIMADQIPGTVYYAAVPDYYGNPATIPKYLADPPEPNVIYLRRIEGKGTRRSQPGLSADPTGVHVGNSGYGGLGLAYLMGAKRVALLGIDGKGGYAHRTGSPRRPLHFLGKLFASAQQQLSTDGVEVQVGSLKSLVSCWPRTRPQQALDWLST